MINNIEYRVQTAGIAVDFLVMEKALALEALRFSQLPGYPTATFSSGLNRKIDGRLMIGVDHVDVDLVAGDVVSVKLFGHSNGNVWPDNNIGLVINDAAGGAGVDVFDQVFERVFVDGSFSSDWNEAILETSFQVPLSGTYNLWVYSANPILGVSAALSGDSGTNLVWWQVFGGRMAGRVMRESINPPVDRGPQWDRLDLIQGFSGIWDNSNLMCPYSLQTPPVFVVDAQVLIGVYDKLLSTMAGYLYDVRTAIISVEDIWAHVPSSPVSDSVAELLSEAHSDIQSATYGLGALKDLVDGLNDLSASDVWDFLIDGTPAQLVLNNGTNQSISANGHLVNGVYGLNAAKTQRDTILANLAIVDGNVDDIETLLGSLTPLSGLDTISKVLEATYTKVTSFVGGGLGERLTNQDGFLDGQAPPVWHDNGQGPVNDGQNPLDDVLVHAYLEDPVTHKWTRLLTVTWTTVDGKWTMMLDDGIYILWFYKDGHVDALEWRAISPDGSVPNPTTDPRDYV